MKKLSKTDPEIMIEWVGTSDGLAPCLKLGPYHDEQLMELARALGRLAARRDLARLRAAAAKGSQSSAEKSVTMKRKAPA